MSNAAGRVEKVMERARDGDKVFDYHDRRDPEAVRDLFSRLCTEMSTLSYLIASSFNNTKHSQESK